jgi:site-specific recombinase XerD
MTWQYWICLYTGTHCTARGLRSSTIAAYRATLEQFRAYVEVRLTDRAPDQVTACDVLGYLEHLRRERDNGDAAVNRQATILKNFYRAIVAMGHLEPRANPMAHFPRLKARARKLPTVLSEEEVRRLLDAPARDTIVGLRDRAMLALLYGTGIRASECAGLLEEDTDLCDATIRVTGKGGHQRTLPLNERVVETLRVYRQARGPAGPEEPFFRSRSKKGLSRGAVYDRVRRHAQRAGLHKRVSPHALRHTFATHLVKKGTDLVTIRDLLGHRAIASSQIYLHVTALDLREAADAHPIGRLAPRVEHLLPNVKLPFQPAPGRRHTG